MEFRWQEIAAVDRAQRVLRGEAKPTASWLWMSLARRFLSHTRRERVVLFCGRMMMCEKWIPRQSAVRSGSPALAGVSDAGLAWPTRVM